MVTTRSQTPKQTKLEDFSSDAKATASSSTGKQSSKRRRTQTTAPEGKYGNRRLSEAKQSSSAASGAVRKQSRRPERRGNAAIQKQKQQQHFSEDAQTLEKPIMINRSPVLQLWGACVAGFLHEDLPWETCLNIGAAIAALCAVSKGRAIGMIEPKDDQSEKGEEEDAKSRALKGELVHVSIPPDFDMSELIDLCGRCTDSGCRCCAV